MPLSRIVDTHVISEAEFDARGVSSFLKQRASATSVRPLDLPMGKVLAAAAPSQPSDVETSQYTAIGYGLPLTVKIEHVYTGSYPERSAFGHRGDMAVFSGVRNFSAANATTRALNYVEPGVSPGTHFIAPTVFNQGTPIILYSPAVTDFQLTFSLEMATKNGFVQNLLDQLSNAFNTLSGLPILLPYAGYLLGAGSLLKLGEDVAGGLYNSSPSFLQTENIGFKGPNKPDLAGWRVVHNGALDITGFSFDPKKGLLGKSGKVYEGAEPYIVISLDGTRNDDLKGFTPAVASAAQLQSFLSMKDGASAAIAALIGAIGVYSDIKYRDKAEKLKEEIDDSSTSAADKANLQAQYDALIKNIVDSSLKPK